MDRELNKPLAAGEQSQSERLFVEGDDAMVLDVESFKGLLGGDMDIVCSILDEFIECAELYYTEARAALEVGDYEVARSRFHKLAGSSASVFASQLRIYSLSGQQLMVDKVYDEATLSPLLAAIESGLPKLRAEIEHIGKLNS
jgi:HPt (histidine-containing phosphotransfer) domain-containing protein